jgi:hypothetical protein
VLRKAGQCVVDVEGLLDLREQVIVRCVGQLLGVGGHLARAGAEPVDAESARQLGDPGADGLVVPQSVEPLEDPREDLLEDVLRVLLWEAEGLNADRGRLRPALRR